MKFWNLLANGKEQSKGSRLEQKTKDLLPEANEEKQVIVACVAGLFARVAHNDMDVKKEEVQNMTEKLGKSCTLNNTQAHAIATLAIQEVQDLAGLENHKYCQPLNDLLNESQKYTLLESLFALAACDGQVTNEESEEIRLIAKGLLLEPQHFISARAKVIEQLSALKK